ncbi:MAG TPA: peptidase [Polyangia bacterium]|nr:peptidase [Polyangia bacterium]
MSRVLPVVLLLTACEATSHTPDPNTSVVMEPPQPSQPAEQPTAAGATSEPAPAGAASASDLGRVASDLAERVGHFPIFAITVDDSKLDARTKSMLRKLTEAGELMDQIVLRQVDLQNPALRTKLVGDPKLKNALIYFDMMKGPWDRTDPQERPFIGTRPRPPQAGFYPQDLSKADLEAWIVAHPQDKAAFQSYFTVIRREGGALVAVPFSQAYQDLLTPAATKLREAAALTDDARIKTFLEKRAAAFASNDYLDSDIAWMELGDAPIEITIGPYEVYDDELMGWKASFEAFVGLRDADESTRLAKVNQSLAALDKNLPLDAKYRKGTARGSASPISVVQLLYSAGQPVPHPTAYNLPNDERVRKAKGSKKVMLKNIGEAKFKAATVPITQRVLVESQQALVTFDAFFTFVLMHEMAHGLGPAMVKTAHGEEEVSKALQDLFGPVEEAKADVCGVVSTQWLVDHDVFPKSLEQGIYAAHLASVFRSVRFGATEAHARGELASFNFLLEKGGFRYDAASKRYAVDFGKVKGAMRALAHEWLTLEATGDRKRTQAFFDKYGVMKPELEAAIATLSGIPIDIRPEFMVLGKLRTW